MFQSIRYGFATNSSSSHSIIFTPQSPWTGGVTDAETYTLLDKADKAKALIPCLPKPENLSAHDVMALTKVLLAHDITPQQWLNDDREFIVDTQGMGLTPPKEIDPHLWLDMIFDPQCSIHSYSDCIEVGDKHHPFTPLTDPSFKLLGATYYNWRWKQDGDAIIGFNAETGMKFRWSKTPYTKSTIPELVDVKITDWCGYNCAFCYQGSTDQGAHAPFENIKACFETLADWGVFEIALGGGEPMAHPQFAEILKLGRSLGLSLSFTTYNKTFDTDYPDILPVLNDVDSYEGNRIINGATGVSVHGPKDVEKLAQLRGRLSNQQCYRNLVAQTVVGATPMRAIERTMDIAIEKGLWFLLLGYKTTGRGLGREKAIDRDAVKNLLLKAKKATEPGAWSGDGADSSFCLAVDTAFLDIYGDLLDELNVPTSMRTSPEGKFSMYIDMVTNQCGPSSYAPHAMTDLTTLKSSYGQW